MLEILNILFIMNKETNIKEKKDIIERLKKGEPTMNHKLWIDNISFKNKPQGYEPSQVGARRKAYMEAAKEDYYSLEQLAEAIQEGKSFTCGVGKVGEHKETSTLLIVDIDNKPGEKQQKLKSFYLEAYKLDIVPNLIYESFSSESNKQKTGYEKYRVIWVLDRELTRTEYEEAIYIMQQVFKNVSFDPASKNIAQIYYSTNKPISIYREAPRLNLRHLVTKYDIKPPKKTKELRSEIIELKDNSKIGKLIKENKYIREALRQPLDYNECNEVIKAFDLFGFDILPYLNFALDEGKSIEKRIQDLERYRANGKGLLPCKNSLGMKVYNIIKGKVEAGIL